MAHKRRSQPAPPWAVWESLSDPVEDSLRRRTWLVLRSDEIPPRVTEATKPSHVVWTSLWPARPRDLIRFEIESDDASGSMLTWRLLRPEQEPVPSDLKHLCYRIQVLINAELRYSFGQ